MLNKNQVGSDQLNLLLNIKRILTSKGNLAIFYMLAKYVPSDIIYIHKILSTYFHK